MAKKQSKCLRKSKCPSIAQIIKQSMRKMKSKPSTTGTHRGSGGAEK